MIVTIVTVFIKQTNTANEIKREYRVILYNKK